MRFVGGLWIFCMLVLLANPHWFVHYLRVVLYIIDGALQLVTMYGSGCIVTRVIWLTCLLAGNSKIIIIFNLSLNEDVVRKVNFLSDCVQYCLRRPNSSRGILEWDEIYLLTDLFVHQLIIYLTCRYIYSTVFFSIWLFVWINITYICITVHQANVYMHCSKTSNNLYAYFLNTKCPIIIYACHLCQGVTGARLHGCQQIAGSIFCLWLI